METITSSPNLIVVVFCFVLFVFLPLIVGDATLESIDATMTTTTTMKNDVVSDDVDDVDDILTLSNDT